MGEVASAGDQSAAPPKQAVGDGFPPVPSAEVATADAEPEPPAPPRSEMPDLPQIAQGSNNGAGLEGEYWDEGSMLISNGEMSMQLYTLGASRSLRRGKKGKSRRRMYVEEVSDPAEK